MPKPMTDWDHIQTVFLAVADLPAAERSVQLDRLCLGDALLRAEVESLLRADRNSAMTIDSAIQGLVSTVLDGSVEIGDRLGAYRVIREIGRGGMGSVYLALRDDEEYVKEVAVKVAKRGMTTDTALQLFRAERQIVANLDHPYIARLFDGGTTDDGVPFFAMEYVEGRPVNVFCRENALDIKARCTLFLRILDAVSYAHQNLIVHGDLKPANIYVKSDGTPKLLDFGIAKMLGADEAQQESLLREKRAYTPGYASPEQVRGSAITVLSDIYSLGAVFYELLSGVRAQPVDFDTPTQIEHAVCDVAVDRPGLIARGLPADLDFVALKALCKSPEQRYRSTEEFAADIRRFLENRPVRARDNTFTYRARKFIVRNAVQVTIAAIVALALVSGLVISLVQTHRARTERAAADAQRQIALRERSSADTQRQVALQERSSAEAARVSEAKQRDLAEHERDEAESEKTQADQRLQDIMQLAATTLFDGNAAMASVPGSMPARQRLVQTTLNYLESLEKEAVESRDMREALTLGYYKLALVQGDPHSASMGDTAGAEKTLRKAEQVLIPAYRRRPGNPGLMLRWIEVHGEMADIAFASGRREEGIQLYADLIPVAVRLSHAPDCNAICQTQLPTVYNSLANQLAPSDPARALQYATQGIAASQAALLRYPSDHELQSGLGSLTAISAGANRNMGNLDQAATDFQRSIAMREAILSADPGNLLVRRNLMVSYGNYAMLLGIPWSPNMGRFDEARSAAQKSVAMARASVAADPSNATARRDLAVAVGRLGMIDPAPGQEQASLDELEESEHLAASVVAANQNSVDAMSLLAQVLDYEGHRLEQLGRKPEALQAYQKSIALLEPEPAKPRVGTPPDYIRVQEDLALLQASSGDSDAGLSLAQKALSTAEAYIATPPATDLKTATLASAWATLATVQAAASQNSTARKSAEKAAGMWDSIRKPALLTAFRSRVAENQKLLSTLP